MKASDTELLSRSRLRLTNSYFCEVILVIFGSDEFYNKIKDALKASDVTIFDDVYRVIDSDLSFLRGSPQMPANAFEDVMQEIQISVWRSMNDYIENSEDKHPNQRNSWLLDIAKKRLYDYCRKTNKKIDKITDSEWQLHEGEYKSVLDSYTDPSSDTEEYYLANISRSKMRNDFFELCRFICGYTGSPENILVFFYNKIIIPFNKGTKSGSPKEIQELFNGKTILELRMSLIAELQIILCCKIPDDVFRELDNKIARYPEYTEKVFSMKDSRISDVSYKIHNVVKNHLEKNMGGV